MKIKGLIVLVLGFLMICLFFSGCGGSGGGSGATIRGQVVINGVPAGPDQVIHYVLANDRFYGGTVISENGNFSHGSGTLDPEYCYPGCTVSLVFIPTETATAAFSETCVYEYIVKDGDNNLGQIDMGLYGFGLVSPENDAEIGPDPWPPQFQWSAYERAGITPEYRFNLSWGYAGSIEKTTQDTSVTLNGDESVTRFNETLGLDDAREWMVYVEYEEQDHTTRHRSEKREITLQPPEA